MDYYSITDSAIEATIGNRIKSLRLHKNMTQQALAQASGLSLNAIKSLEKGQSRISTLIAVLRELGALDDLDNFIPEITVSPLQVAKLQGKVRERATGSRKKEQEQGDPEW